MRETQMEEGHGAGEREDIERSECVQEREEGWGEEKR